MPLHEMSHPTWVRGLKLNILISLLRLQQVAPYVGAWIETLLLFWMLMLSLVAPYVGAWIETNFGSKEFAIKDVAPYVGAWIETSNQYLA